MSVLLLFHEGGGSTAAATGVPTFILLTNGRLAISQGGILYQEI